MLKVSKRLMLIDEILKDLESIRDTVASEHRYAVEKNIEFFRASKSIFSYIKWLFLQAPKIDSSRLLELIDLPLPRWSNEMHKELIHVQKTKFPLLIRPLVQRLYSHILKRGSLSILIDLGCGGMEVERQVIVKLEKIKNLGKVIFVGVDKDPISRKLAKQNLEELGLLIEVFEVNKLDSDKLVEIFNLSIKKYVIILCENDVFNLNQQFKFKDFDILYHSLFMHHINMKEREYIDEIAKKIANKTIEYDGYKSWFSFLPESILSWNAPALLNGSIFSNLRYPTKKVLKSINIKKLIRFHKVGKYLVEK